MIGEGTLAGATGRRGDVAIRLAALPWTSEGLAALSAGPSLASAVAVLALGSTLAQGGATALAAGAVVLAIAAAAGLYRAARRRPAADVASLSLLVACLAGVEIAQIGAGLAVRALWPDWEAVVVLAIAGLSAMHALARLTTAGVALAALAAEDGP